MKCVENKKKAVLFMLFSSLCFAFMAALVKLAGSVPTFEKAFFRNFISLIVSTAMILYNKKKFWGKPENTKYLVARSVLGTIGMLAYFYCIDNMVLADSSMLNKMHPFFVTIFAIWFLKEKLTPVQIPALIIAFLGALFIIKPQFNVQVIPAVIGFLSAAFAGAAYTVVRFLGDKEEFYTVVFYFSLISSLICIPLMLMNFKTPSIIQLIMLIGAGVFSAMGQFALTIGYKYAPASEVAIFNYTNVIFSGLIAFFIWHEVPDMLSLLGYISIIGAALLVYAYTKRCMSADKKQ